MPNIVLAIDGLEYSGWSDFEFSTSLDSMCGLFAFGLRHTSETMAIGPGLPIQAFVDGSLLFTGYIDARERKVSSNAFSVAFSGREKTGDLVDCCAEYKTGVWKTATSVQKIVQALCSPYGISCEDPAGYSLKRFSLDDGETVFSAIDRISRFNKTLPRTTPEGNVTFVPTSFPFANDLLMLGDNVFNHEDTVDYTNRFSKYTAKGQTDSGTSIDYFGNSQEEQKWSATISGTAEDKWMSTFMGRFRNTVLHPEFISSNAKAKDIAEWEAKTRAARSTSITLSVKGWYQADGITLWAPGMRVKYIAEMLGIVDTFDIASVAYSYSKQSGTVAVLTLCLLGAYTPEPLKDVKPRTSSTTNTSINYFSNDQAEKKTTTTTTTQVGAVIE